MIHPRFGRYHSTSFKVLLVMLLSAAPQAYSQTQPGWASQPYAYVVIDQNVRDALQAFGRNLNIPVVISPKVTGRAAANLRAQTAGAFLEKLTTNNTLTWFSDGNMLYVDSEDELQTRHIDALGISAADLQASLDQLGVCGNNLRVRDGFGGEGLLVSGPPAFMSLVQQRIDQFLRDRPAPVVTREHGVRVFRGSSPAQVVPSKRNQ